MLRGHKDSIMHITDLPDGRLATGSWDKTVRIWSTKGEELYVLHGHEGEIRCITALPDGRLATGASDKTMCLWPREGEELQVLTCNTDDTDEFWCITALPDGRLATDSGDTVCIWSPDLNVLYESSLEVDEWDTPIHSPDSGCPWNYG